MSTIKLFVQAYQGAFCLTVITLWSLWENGWQVDGLVIAMTFVTIVTAVASAFTVVQASKQ